MKSRDLQMIKPSLRRRQKRRDKRMHEELIECYRKGDMKGKKKGYRKLNSPQNWDTSLKNERIKWMKSETKCLDDNLGPLIRFLESKKGKYWDKVYSELCQRMDKKSVIGQHLFDHLMDFVYTNVYVVNGKVYSMNWRQGEHELKSSRWWPMFYVHPKSGVLVKVKKRREKYEW